ncbi:hypothetical protein GGR58DRAFT_518054 [Xylaria digitata]|nr:hypothetical protein GGR58DRAFT_518054 [Xylaria digitata]
MTFSLTATTQPSSSGSLDDSTFTKSTSISSIAATSKVSPHTTTPALTTIFTPSSICTGRYYIWPQTAIRGIVSGTVDRLYSLCQPSLTAFRNYYSPAVCPQNMEIAAVSSNYLYVTADTTYVDICCQRHGTPLYGFAWDFTSCYSIVSTKTTVLVAPTVTGEDLYTTTSGVYAWHASIFAAWETTDLSLFPPEAMRQKSSIAEYGWVANSTSLTTSTPTKSGASPPEQSRESTEGSLSTGAIVGIAIAAVAFGCLFVAFIYSYRRHHWPQDRPSRLNQISTGARETWQGNAWRAEMSSPTMASQMPDTKANWSGRKNSQTIDDSQYGREQAPVELDGPGS